METSDITKSEQEKSPKTNKDSSPFEILSNNLTSMGSILRVLEERYSNIRKKTQMTDQNLLEFEKSMKADLRSLNQDLLDIKRSVSEINQNLSLMSSELAKAVKQSEFRVLEKYVDMWQPMSFVTKDEFNKLFKSKK
ncbi:MAG: hypothetical protein ABH828_05560 [archaeon]